MVIVIEFTCLIAPVKEKKWWKKKQKQTKSLFFVILGTGSTERGLVNRVKPPETALQSQIELSLCVYTTHIVAQSKV